MLGEAPTCDADSSASFAIALETVGVDMLSEGRRREVADRAWKDLLWPAYRIRRASTLAEPSGSLEPIAIEAVDALLSHRQPEIRHRLMSVELVARDRTKDWDEHLRQQVLCAFLLLVRRSAELNDGEMIRQILSRLRQEQASGEEELAGRTDHDGSIALSRAVALYHAARAIEIAADYALGTAPPTWTAFAVRDEIALHASDASRILRGLDDQLARLVMLLSLGLRSVASASVRALVLPPGSRELVDAMAARPVRPVTELWYAQRLALNKSLLDPAKSAVVVSMPTSAGKTLLAEMCAVEALRAYPQKTVLYLAPSRALVTQAAMTLRKDLAGLGEWSIQVASPGFELDPIEDEILAAGCSVLVTTPEKADLLIRSSHPALSDVSLVVVDEAHTLGDGPRGSRLELLLAILRRERPGCRFVLLTPFAENAAELAEWLGGEQGAPILIDWKPSDRVIGAVKRVSRKRVPHLQMTSLDTARSDFPGDVQLELGEAPAGTTASKKSVAIATAVSLANVRNGGVLLLTSSRKKATEYATDVSRIYNAGAPTAVVDLVARYLEQEAGGPHPLAEAIRKGVAFHHAGLSPEARYLVERLVENGEIRIVCATTTLAQGVHFPLSVAVVEDTKRYCYQRGRGSWQDIPPSEMWNIAGRVGRTLEDPLGTVLFPARNDADVSAIESYLEKDSEKVTSSLLGTLRLLGARNVEFTTTFLSDHEPLAAFLQYVLHSVARLGPAQAQLELARLIRGSLAYSEASEVDPALAERLLSIAEQYLDALIGQKRDYLPRYAEIADSTGFSSPSVDLVFAALRDEISTDNWAADTLLPTHGETSPVLAACLGVLGRVPEIRLGDRERGEFSPERIARITTDWVNGMTLSDLAASQYQGDVLAATRHIYSAVVGLVPWGLRSAARIVLADKVGDWTDVDTLPAMVMYGVRSRGAIGLRMQGVPRFVAEGLALEAQSDNVPVGGMEEWIAGVSDERWQRSIQKPLVSGSECRRLWETMAGRRKWSDLVD